MFGLGAPELIIILVIVLVVFGAGKLPQVLGSLGKGVREFREASEGKDSTADAAQTPPANPPVPGPNPYVNSSANPNYPDPGYPAANPNPPAATAPPQAPTEPRT